MEIDKFNQLSAKIRQGELDEVWGALETEVDAKDVDIQFLLGLYYRAKNEYDLAVKHYEMAAGIAPKNPDILHGLGVAYQLSGQLDDAIKSFRKCVEMQPGNVLAWNSIGVTFRKMGEYPNALGAYEKGLSSLIDSAYATLVSEHGPKFPLADEYLIGDGLRHWNKLAMETAITHAVKDGKKHVLFPTGETAVQMHSDSETHQDLFLDDESGDRKVLPNYFSSIFSLLKTNTLYSQLLGNLAATYIHTGDLDLAEKLTRESIEFVPKDSNPTSMIEQLRIIHELREKKK